MTASRTESATAHTIKVLAYGAAILCGLGFGFDVGQRMSGPIVGSIMAINSAVFGALCVSALTDWLARAREKVGRRG
jgi:hypothetical protein